MKLPTRWRKAVPRLRDRWLRSMVLLVMAVGLLALTAPTAVSVPWASGARPPVRLTQTTPPAAPRRLSPGVVAELVYQQMPEIPLENQYIDRDTREVASTNTLMSRFISYHTVTKFRPPNFRLDWKLTLADYLGVNERMSPSAYPGSSVLRTNPLPGDVAAIGTLNRRQRDRLVDLLVSIYTEPAP